MRKRYLISDPTGADLSDEKRSSLQSAFEAASDDVAVKKFTSKHVVVDADPDFATQIKKTEPDLIVEEDEPLTRF
jgi:hypothetical protein